MLDSSSLVDGHDQIEQQRVSGKAEVVEAQEGYIWAA